MASIEHTYLRQHVKNCKQNGVFYTGQNVHVMVKCANFLGTSRAHVF